VPGTPAALAVASAAFLLVALHTWRALGAARAAAELTALALFLYLGGASTPPALAVALAVTLASLSLASWLWWLSPLSRSSSAAFLAAAVALGLAPAAVRSGVLAGTPDGPFLGAPLALAATALVLVFSWTIASELRPGRDARALALRTAVALGGLLAAWAARWTWARLELDALLPPGAAWLAWGALWSAPTVLAITGRAALLPESLAGLLGSAGRRLPAFALLVLLAAALAAVVRVPGHDPLLAVAAAGPMLPALALLSTHPPLDHWRGRAFARLGKVQGFVAVLMKPRNGLPWTDADRAFLRAGLRTLVRWAPGFVLFLLPGGMPLLALYAWLLDRRRGRAPGVTPGGRRGTDNAAA
jgi:hypothetical protein